MMAIRQQFDMKHLGAHHRVKNRLRPYSRHWKNNRGRLSLLPSIGKMK
jgi:hypothetical protein